MIMGFKWVSADFVQSLKSIWLNAVEALYCWFEWFCAGDDRQYSGPIIGAEQPGRRGVAAAMSRHLAGQIKAGFF